jgi:hypothetical protein
LKAADMTLESDPISPRYRRAFARASTRAQRSRVTNNSALLPNTDGRLAISRRFKDIASQIISDHGHDVSETTLQLIRRFAECACLAELEAAKLMRGEPISVPEICQLVSTMTRVAARIGCDRVPVDITDDAISAAIREEYSP